MKTFPTTNCAAWWKFKCKSRSENNYFKVNHFLKPQSIDIIFQTQFVKKNSKISACIKNLQFIFVSVLQHEKALTHSALFKPSFSPVIQNFQICFKKTKPKGLTSEN